MKTCPVCGEPVASRSGVCPYCESPQPLTADAFSAPGPSLRVINLEAGLPTVDEALTRLATQLSRARADGVRLVRIIHGWGSSTGGGGRIRTAARAWLLREAEARRIGAVLFGDHYTHTTSEGRDWLRRHPVLRPQENQDRQNPGITFVEP